MTQSDLCQPTLSLQQISTSEDWEKPGAKAARGPKSPFLCPKNVHLRHPLIR